MARILVYVALADLLTEEFMKPRGQGNWKLLVGINREWSKLYALVNCVSAKYHFNFHKTYFVYENAVITAFHCD